MTSAMSMAKMLKKNAMISSHPDIRTWTDHFAICVMLFIVQHWENLKKFGKKKWKENSLSGFEIRLSKLEKREKMFNSTRGKQFLTSPEQTAKCKCSRCWKKSTTMPYICQEVKHYFSKQLNYQVCIDFFISGTEQLVISSPLTA